MMSREEWLALRRLGLGSSDAPAVCGLVPWCLPLEVYLDKVSGTSKEATRKMRMGQLCEAAVAQLYTEETGKLLLGQPDIPLLLRHPTFSWMLASVDRARLTEEGPRVVEIKTVWGDESKEWGEPGSDDVPKKFYVQVQHQLAVVGWDVAEIVLWVRGEALYTYEVPRNEGVIKELLRIEGDFWEMVQTRREPPLDYEHPDALALIKRRYPSVDERAHVSLGQEEDDLARELCLLQEDIHQRQCKEKALKAALLVSLREAAVGHTPGGYQVTRKVVTKRAYEVKAHSEVHFKVRPPALLAASKESA